MKFGRYKLTNQRAFVKFTFVCVLVCFLIFFAVLNIGKVFGSSNNDYHRVVVKSGDTIWEVAQSNIPTGVDIRDFVAQIKDKNELKSSFVQEGQVLLIPLKR